MSLVNKNHTVLSQWLFSIISLMLFSSITVADSKLAAYLTDDHQASEYGQTKEGVLHVNAKQAQHLLELDDNIVVLDVRTFAEHQEQRIRSDVNIDYYSSEFKTALNRLDKDAVYLVHCRSGKRSGNTLPILAELGFKNVIHLDGGIRAWRAEGLGPLSN